MTLAVRKDSEGCAVPKGVVGMRMFVCKRSRIKKLNDKPLCLVFFGSLGGVSTRRFFFLFFFFFVERNEKGWIFGSSVFFTCRPLFWDFLSTGFLWRCRIIVIGVLMDVVKRFLIDLWWWSFFSQYTTIFYPILFKMSLK